MGFKVTSFVGKGGVGKTILALSYALQRANEHEQVALIDFDGGHAAAATLRCSEIYSNSICNWNSNFCIVVVEPLKYESIASVQARGGSFTEYLNQFVGDYGLLPWADLPNAFFGVPTDPETLGRTLSLLRTLYALKERGTTEVVIDMEPTEGLARLLRGSDRMVASLRNLATMGKPKLALLGQAWPDIRSYLDGPYMASIGHYTDRLKQLVTWLKGADYWLTATPEHVPVVKALEVRDILGVFGGQAAGCVINNIQADHDLGVITPLLELGLPVAMVDRVSALHEPGLTDPIPHLMTIGRQVAERVAPVL